MKLYLLGGNFFELEDDFEEVFYEKVSESPELVELKGLIREINDVPEAVIRKYRTLTPIIETLRELELEEIQDAIEDGLFDGDAELIHLNKLNDKARSYEVEWFEYFDIRQLSPEFKLVEIGRTLDLPDPAGALDYFDEHIKRENEAGRKWDNNIIKGKYLRDGRQLKGDKTLKEAFIEYIENLDEDILSDGEKVVKLVKLKNVSTFEIDKLTQKDNKIYDQITYLQKALTYAHDDPSVKLKISEKIDELKETQKEIKAEIEKAKKAQKEDAQFVQDYLDKVRKYFTLSEDGIFFAVTGDEEGDYPFIEVLASIAELNHDSKFIIDLEEKGLLTEPTIKN